MSTHAPDDVDRLLAYLNESAQRLAEDAALAASYASRRQLEQHARAVLRVARRLSRSMEIAS